MPRISIVIPTYNSESFLSKTIESALAQTFKDFELIVVDDCSKDKTPQIIRSFEQKDPRIRGLFLHENSGSPARPNNIAFRQCQGEFIAFLAHDDIWLPEKLEKQLLLFSKNESLDFVGCDTIVIQNDQKLLKKIAWQNDSARLMLIENIIPYPSSIVVRQKTLNQLGGMDEQLKTMDDWDLWIRALLQGCKFGFVNEPLLKYTIHGENLSRQKTYDIFKNDYQIFFDKHRNSFTRDRKILGIQLRKLASFYCLASEIARGRNLYLQAIAKNLFDLKSYFYLFLSFLGQNLFEKIYHFRKRLN